MIASLIQASAELPPPKDLPVAPPTTLSAAQALPQVQAGSLFADRNLQLTLIVLFFALLALVLLYLMVRHERAGPFELRIFIITILVFGSLLILSAGFGGDQLGPVIGFFGTIAGYVLGRGDRPSERS
jgi:lipopolysaccharide export LptBFGC system permease protein LptF